MSVETPKAPPLPVEMEKLLRGLRLPYVRKAAPEVLATAASQRREPLELLRVLMEAEAAGRAEAAIRIRRKRSGLPAGKTFDAWEEEASSVPAATQQALRTLEWVERSETLCVCEPSGTGKSHFVEALGHLAIDKGKDRRLAHAGEPGGAPARPPRRRLGRQGDRQADPHRPDRDR